MFRVRDVCVRCAFVLGALLIGTPARAAMMLPDVASSEYEALATNTMFDSVGCLFASTSGAWETGSAVLVSPEWVLTAAHLVSGTSGTVLFYLGDSIYEGYTDKVTADSWVINDGVDLALVHLSQPIVDVSPAVLYTGTDEIGTHIYAAGYGDPATWPNYWTDFDGVQRAGENIVDGFGDPVWGLGDEYMFVDFGPAHSTTSLSLEWGGTPGDSGGGWFNDEGQLIAITSFGEGLAADTGAIRVSLYADWIFDTVGSTEVPEPSTLLLFASGIFGGSVLRRSRENKTVREGQKSAVHNMRA